MKDILIVLAAFGLFVLGVLALAGMEIEPRALGGVLILAFCGFVALVISRGR